MQSLQHLIRQYRLLTDWYLSVTEGVSEQDGKKTISDTANSLQWLSGHLVVGRYRNMLRLGIEMEPYKDLDKFVNQTIPPPNAIAFNKNMQYPSLAECREQWIRYSKIFLDKLNSADETVLKTEIPFSVLTGGNTVEDALTFTVLHETFHIGQMSMIRKYLGYNAMQLSPRK